MNKMFVNFIPSMPCIQTHIVERMGISCEYYKLKKTNTNVPYNIQLTQFVLSMVIFFNICTDVSKSKGKKKHNYLNKWQIIFLSDMEIFCVFIWSKDIHGNLVCKELFDLTDITPLNDNF